MKQHLKYILLLLVFLGTLKQSIAGPPTGSTNNGTSTINEFYNLTIQNLGV